MNKLLEVQGLKTVYDTEDGRLVAVDNVSFNVLRGETLAIVGESGSGKSQTAFSILQLISQPGKIIAGSVKYENQELLSLNNKQMQKIRGNEISIIFQEPMTSLNPVQTIGKQIAEGLILHQGLTKKQALVKAVTLLKQVGISDPQKRVKEYPHQMSGGMRQRVMIAMALACKPKLLIADEPTTALDVTIQAQILAEMDKLKQKLDMSILLITHDLGVVAEMADRVVVMYAGQVVEVSSVFEIFESPKHPYTIGLIKSMPTLHDEKEWLAVIKGSVPDPLQKPQGCKFHPRCVYAKEKCKTSSPPITELNNNSCVRCWYPQNIQG
ncbi:ABC transporter ATP-binding protein [Clostridium sp. 'deep sea']|uniref:ABC transporter ATP-binding protein n=1 Tax=Clostridium sp. 'deep sea' TaxID=2779445 RepID=UPI0018967CB9|nr:ABC transporter ATP-binding protein [Clostridium sp. 'deep sea']QOR34370.1 ABC transporter ATP-binding protein [Clostridium sp. 'deep sea']